MQTAPPLPVSAPAPRQTTSPIRPKFPHDHTGFHAELRRRVAEYFATTGKRERGPWRMYLKTAIIFAWLITTYALLVFWAPAWWAAVPLTAVMAAAMAAAAFNVQHDGGHRAYSDRSWVNRLAALSLDMIGASSYLWHWKHVVFHHTYSNISGHDADIELGSLMRFCPHHQRRWFHRWQHFYLWPLYGLMAARWHLVGDFQDVYKGMVGPHKIPRPRGLELAIFVGGKVFSIGWLIVLPMFFHDWWVVLIYYFLATAVMGVILSVVFQLAHCVGEADFPLPVEGTMRMEDGWAIHQVQTTADFARGSRVLSWLLGGLNFQIEHHLFPQVCHIHYPALSGIVENVCREYGIRYSSHPTFWAGIVSHYRWLREMGLPTAQPAQA